MYLSDHKRSQTLFLTNVNFSPVRYNFPRMQLFTHSISCEGIGVLSVNVGFSLRLIETPQDSSRFRGTFSENVNDEISFVEALLSERLKNVSLSPLTC